MRNRNSPLCYGSTAKSKAKSTTKTRPVFLWLDVGPILYGDINLLLCSSFLLRFLWPDFVYISWLYLTLKICSDSPPVLSIIAGYQCEKNKVSSYSYLQSFGFFVTECFIEEAEETIYFRISLNPAFPPKCSQIDPDHLFENRLHTAEECITCPWTAAYFVLCIYIFPKEKKKKAGFSG